MNPLKLEINQKCFVNIYLESLKGLTPGKVWINSSGDLQCSMILNQQFKTLNLSSDTSITHHPDAATEFESLNLPTKEGYYLKLSSEDYFCYLVFDDEKLYNSWVLGLGNFISTKQTIELNENYGSIYDLTVLDTEGNSWVDVKLTAVTSSMNSNTKYFFFDLAQSNLYLSVKEVLCSVEGHLDLINTLIFKEFLLDIVRNDFLGRSSSDLIKESRLKSFEFRAENNHLFKKYYKTIHRDEIDENVAELLRKSSVIYDKTSNALKVLELQKLTLQMQLQDFFVSRSDKANLDIVSNMEKNLEMILKKKEEANPDLNNSCLNRNTVCSCEIV